MILEKKFIPLLLKNIVKNRIYEKLLFSVLICHRRISKTYMSLFSVAHFLHKRNKLINFSSRKGFIFFEKGINSRFLTLVKTEFKEVENPRLPQIGPREGKR